MGKKWSNFDAGKLIGDAYAYQGFRRGADVHRPPYSHVIFPDYSRNWESRAKKRKLFEKWIISAVDLIACASAL